MSLHAHVVVRLGTLDLDVEFEVEDGETIALLGPNAAGKSTTVRAIAGLVPLSGGEIVSAGRVLECPGSGVSLAPEERRVGLVFQHGALVEHLDALENVAFGLRARGTGRSAARDAARVWLERFELAEAAGLLPGQMSGGQRQRVALARALVIEPDLLLLDEPLSALDAGTVGRVRRDLRLHLATFAGPRVLVTHDPVDAYALADRVIVIEQGRVVQTGSMTDVAAAPRSRYVSELVGLNLIDGTLGEAAFVSDDGITVRLDGTIAGSAPGRSSIVFAPRAARVARSDDGTAEVADVELAAGHFRVRLAARASGPSTAPTADRWLLVEVPLEAGEGLQPGTPCRVSVDAAAASIVPGI